MELKEFVTESIRQILDGISAAQVAEGGDAVNASPGTARDLGGSLINCGDYGILCRIDFDVAVSAETSGSGGAKLSVFGAGVGGEGAHKSSSANRITFSIPVRLPDGDKTRAENVDEEHRQKRASTPIAAGAYII